MFCLQKISGGKMTTIETLKKIKQVLTRNGLPSDIAHDVTLTVYDASTIHKMACPIITAIEGLADEDAPKDSWQHQLFRAWKNIRVSEIDLRTLRELRIC